MTDLIEVDQMAIHLPKIYDLILDRLYVELMYQAEIEVWICKNHTDLLKYHSLGITVN